MKHLFLTTSWFLKTKPTTLFDYWIYFILAKEKDNL